MSHINKGQHTTHLRSVGGVSDRVDCDFVLSDRSFHFPLIFEQVLHAVPLVCCAMVNLNGFAISAIHLRLILGKFVMVLLMSNMY